MPALIPNCENSQHALAMIAALRSAGHVAYLAGGCVRDALLGGLPKDYDIATDATPMMVRKLFGYRRTLPIGAAFGVINVLPPRGSGGQPVEVATFRSDGAYSDGRRPDSVHFGDPQADALRRDFTINGLFYDPANDRVIDFVEGQRDLQERRVRAIGNAHQRFAEDKLRMLRAVRFASLFDFALDEETAAAVRVHAVDIQQVSGERIGAEMRRMLASPAAAPAMQMIVDLQLARHILPTQLVAVAANNGVLEWLAARTSPDLPTSLAILVACACGHDPSARPNKLLADLFHRWKLSTSERDAASDALAAFPTFVQADQLPWSVVQPLLTGRHALPALALADAYLQTGPSTDLLGVDKQPHGVALCRERKAWPAERLDPPPLLDGSKLKQQGFKPGPKFREILSAVRAAQLDGQIHTPAQALVLASAMDNPPEST